MRLPLLEHSGLYLTREFLIGNPPAPVQPSQTEYAGSGPEPDWERISADLNSVMQSGAEPASTDGAVARIIHQAFSLTRREAADMRFWHYVAVVKFPHYVAWRYFDARTGATSKNRYAGLLDDNAIARLWWFAELTLDPQNVDQYWRTERTATSLEFVKGVVENLLGGNRLLVRGLADALFNGNGKPLDSLVQRVFTSANVVLVSVAVDALSPDEIDRLVKLLIHR